MPPVNNIIACPRKRGHGTEYKWYSFDYPPELISIFRVWPLLIFSFRSKVMRIWLSWSVLVCLIDVPDSSTFTLGFRIFSGMAKARVFISSLPQRRVIVFVWELRFRFWEKVPQACAVVKALRKSLGVIRGMKKTAVIPKKMTKKYWIRRGIRYDFMKFKSASSSEWELYSWNNPLYNPTKF